jgi:hypothetical protein
MKTYAICPISEKLADENITRLNASFTIILLGCYAFTHQIFFIVFLAFDFLMRGLEQSQYSPITHLSKWLAIIFDFRKIKINAGPKLFAARIGLTFLVLIIASVLSGYQTLGYILAFTLGLFCFLEAAFGVCVACKLYPFLYNFLYK